MNAIIESAPAQFLWKRIDNFLHCVGFVLVIGYYLGYAIVQSSVHLPALVKWLFTDVVEFTVVMIIVISLIVWIF
jgi:hypothetical protein